MSPRTEKQFEIIRDNKKVLIKEVGLELFSKEGFHSTSIRMIAKKAGISKGLIYNYYESKDDLLLEIINDGFARLMSYIDPDGDGELTRNEMEYMIEENFRILREQQAFWMLYFSIFLQPDVIKIVSDQIQIFYTGLLSLFTDYFRRAGYANPELEALLFGAIMDGISINFLLNMADFPVEDIKRRLLELFSSKPILNQ
jgi:AcrR family transcriptional regulator